MEYLDNAKQSFAEVREKCPGMTNDIYALTDYISSVISDRVTPQELSMCMTLISDDLQKGRNGFKNEPLPPYLEKRRAALIQQLIYITQVIDNIANEKFADEYRNICKKVYGYSPPKYIIKQTNNEYPENVRIAVEWWINTVQPPAYNKTGNEKSEENIKLFKDTLSKSIIEELNQKGSCSILVDYYPCEILSNAGNKIGLDDMTSYPWKTLMNISNESVEVTSNLYNGKTKPLWKKGQNKGWEEINVQKQSIR